VKLAFLNTLEAVLRRGSFAAAAHDVRLTASAVSLQIKELEKYFGQPLFDRSARIARPTPFASELAASVRGALATIEALRDRRSPVVAGRVALGTIRSVQTATLPAALLELRTRFPWLDIRLAQGDTPVLLRDIKAGELDAAVVVRPEMGGSSRLCWRNLARELFVLLAPPDVKGDSVVELLHKHEWIRLDTSMTGGRIAASFVHRVAPRARARLDLVSIEAIAAMVSSGLGVSVVPSLRGPLREAYRVREIGLGRRAPVRQIAFVCRAADLDNRRVSAIREAFEHAYGAASQISKADKDGAARGHRR
jgi:DNA-binding transcriptional LysR family regulator